MIKPLRYTALSTLSLLLIASCAKEEPPPKEVIRPVLTMKVTDVAQFRQRWFPGRARGTQEVDLSFRVAGPLITLPAKVGDVVDKGNVVARIDPRDFEVNLRNVKGQLENAKAAQERAEKDYKRLLQINKVDPGATSEAAIDKAKQKRDSARANVRSLNASLSAAQDQLDYSYLRAPFTGTVVSTYVENFEDVAGKQPVLRLVDNSRIEMVINIPENLISLSPHVKSATVTFDSFPDTEVVAQIKEVGTEASETTRTYPVTLIMDQPKDVRILPGMAGKATGREIDLPEQMATRSIQVPIAATFSSNDGESTFVWVIDEASSTVARRQVKVGQLADHGVRIEDGLKAGEMIATAGVHYLKEGQKVRILSDKAE